MTDHPAQKEVFEATLTNTDGADITIDQFKDTFSYVSRILGDRKPLPKHVQLWAYKGTEDKRTFFDIRDEWDKVTKAEALVVVPGEHASLSYDSAHPDQIKLSVTFNHANANLQPDTQYKTVQDAKAELEQALILGPQNSLKR